MATLKFKVENLQDPIIGSMFKPFEEVFVSKAFTRNAIIITENKNRVYLFQIDNRRIVQEWRLNSLHTLSSGAIQHSDQIHFSAIIDKQNLRTWSLNDKTMHHKTSNIKLLKPGIGLIYFEGGTILIIYQDGSLGCAADIHSNWKPDVMNISDGFAIKDYTHLVVDKYCLVKLLLINKIGESYLIEYKFDKSSDLQVTSTIQLIQKPFFKFLNLYAGLRLADNFTSVPLDGQQYVVNGPLPDCQHSQSHIYIWDAGFELIRSKELHNTINILKLLRIEENIIVVTLNGIFGIFLDYRPSSLISCILQQEENTIGDFKSTGLDSKMDLLSIYNNSKCNFFEKVKAWFDSITQLKPCQRILMRSQVDPVVLQLAQSSIIGDDDLERSNNVDTIMKIIKTGLVTSRCCLALLDLAEKTKNVELIFVIIKFIPNIHEAIIVDMLSTFLQHSPDGTSHTELNLILNLPFTRENMVSCLKDLPIHLLLTLLQILYERLIGDNTDSNDCLEDLHDARTIDWLSMLMDSHYSKLILHSDCQTFVNEIRACIQQRVFDAKKRIFASFSEKYMAHERRQRSKQKRRYVVQSFVY